MNIYPKKDTTQYKDWSINKKEKPRNVIDNSDNNAIAPFAGVHYEKYIGVQKNTYAHRLKHIKKLNM